MSMAKKGICRSDEVREILSKAKLKQWQNPEYAEKQLAAIYANMKNKPNKPERRLRNGLDKMFPGEYEFVGNGRVWFGHKNPDFININGQKKIIEIFGDYWHSKKITGLPKKEHRIQRQKHFAGYGYRTLVIWEHELKNIPKLKKKLKVFHKVV